MAKNKTAITIALFMILTVTATLLTCLPTSKAATNTYVTYVYAVVNPDTVGVGEQILLQWWTADMPPDVGEIAAAAGERAAWKNVGWYVTDPDGNTETVTVARTDPVGSTWSLYTPDQVGTYTVQGFFPETVKTLPNGDVYTYKAANSTKVTFAVTEARRAPWPEAPLPTGYWTRPINTASRQLYVLAGNWLGGAAQNYPWGAGGGSTTRFVSGTGPESAHILWTKPYYVGGLMDAKFGDTGYQTAHYQGLGLTALIVNGKIFYAYRGDAHQTEGYLVVDLYTGETLAYVNSTMPGRAQVYNYESPNQHGGYAYIWQEPAVDFFSLFMGIPPSGNWKMIDAFTGRAITEVANVSMGVSLFGMSMGGTPVYGKDGSLTNYNLVDLDFGPGFKYYLQLFNMSAIPSMLGGTTGTDAWQWRPSGGSFGAGRPLGYYVHNGNTGYSLNVSLAATDVNGPVSSIINQTGSIYAVREDEYIIIGTPGQNNELGVVQGKMTAFSLKKENVGTKLWSTTFTPPFASIVANITGGGFFGGGLALTGVYPEDGVIVFYSSKQLKRWGFSLDTGKQLWESKPEIPMSFYGTEVNVYEGKLYTYGYGGQIRTYNITTGDILWTYNATVVGQEIGYGGNQPIGISAIADGKLYTVCGEHSPTQPLWRGQNLRCINATTGEEIWKILFWGGGMSATESNTYMADGIIVGLNLFDNEIYAFGKGPSGITVSVPQNVPTLGSSVTITGTVTDQTETGRRTTNDNFEFSLKGTPAISDEDMSAWMEYMFMQQAKPADAKGVEVSLDTIDPNGNYVHIGTVTSDVYGNYGFKFTPEVPGSYQIIATFAGSKSYWGSAATTYLSVDEAPPATAPPEYPQPIDNTWTIIGVGIVLLIAIVIVGLLILRKK